MTAHAEVYEFPPIRKYMIWRYYGPRTNMTASQQELDEYKIPFHSRDKCAQHMINYYKCLDKGTSFCFTTKDEFYKCQYIALKQRLEAKTA